MDKYYITNNKNISAAYIWINGGSSLDGNKLNGINQILCTLLTRGCKSFDNFEISNIFNSNGAEIYYETLQDGILIGFKSLNEYFKNLHPLLELLVESSILPEKEFIKCKDIQINYLFKLKENLFLKTFNNWRKIVYKDHPYSFDSNGYLETINNIKYEDILKEYNKFKQRKKYLLSNFKINNAIDIKYQNIKEKKFTNYSTDLLITNKRKRYTEIKLSTNQLIIMLGNQTCSHNDRDFLYLKILESYLSFGMSSVLFRVFREKNGLTYDVGVINPTRIKNAPFLIYISVSPLKAKLALKLLNEIWNKFLTQLIPLQELNLAKTKLRNSILNSNQETEEIILRKVQLIGYQMSANFDFESIEKLRKINSEDIRKVANKYLKNPYLSILGDPKICDEIRNNWEEGY